MRREVEAVAETERGPDCGRNEAESGFELLLVGRDDSEHVAALGRARQVRHVESARRVLRHHDLHRLLTSTHRLTLGVTQTHFDRDRTDASQCYNTFGCTASRVTREIFVHTRILSVYTTSICILYELSL